MARSGNRLGLIGYTTVLTLLVTVTAGADIFLDWNVSISNTSKPVSIDQRVITINGMFPGPLINVTTNDNIHVNVFNNIDEPLLFTWNGIQQRLNSWQDGVSGTNCPIQPGKNWTYVFKTKDQIGSFFYFPSINFQKAGGGFGPIRVNNRQVIKVPFPKPEAEFDLLIGDWYQSSYKDVRSMLDTKLTANDSYPHWMLINGKGYYMDPLPKDLESFTITQGKTYRFRISNVGTAWSFNFRIQNHQMILVETEGSYTNQITLNSLDVHVGQSYSVLVTADQSAADYYMVATPKMYAVNDNSRLVGIAVLHYDNSTTPANGPLPSGPDPFDVEFSINQAKSIRWNMTAGAARPNPQGTFNVTNVTLSQTFILRASEADIDGVARYTVNNVSYLTPDTPLKLADYKVNGSGFYELDAYPTNYSDVDAVRGVFVASGNHKGWIELVLKNDLDTMDAWHLDGFGFHVVGLGHGEWRPELRSTYNLYDPVVRSTVQVYPGSWSAVYAYLDNPGMWNLRSQKLKNWYLGQELYLRVYDADPNPAKEQPAPDNLLLCGKFEPPAPPPAPLAPPNAPANAPALHITWSSIAMISIVTIPLYWLLVGGEIFR
ncbi:monocopper oxidase-like protein SKU5 [Quillaja saponaria]|uniref:Monocopper oxidase-like protein SKU5 n=1 Tax=Quillaja saponaria TaxID=32244 RepID=A0AAD7Q590_QUISA|nr:monocopper oxidase-like protein SKU5 [Quillaja saponaria]